MTTTSDQAAPASEPGGRADGAEPGTPQARAPLTLPVAAGVLNFIGMLFLLTTFLGILERQKMEERPPDMGDGLQFFVCAVPTLAVCLILNCCWAVKSYRDVRRHGDQRSLMWLGIVCLGWMALYFGSYCL